MCVRACIRVCGCASSWLPKENGLCLCWRGSVGNSGAHDHTPHRLDLGSYMTPHTLLSEKSSLTCDPEVDRSRKVTEMPAQLDIFMLWSWSYDLVKLFHQILQNFPRKLDSSPLPPPTHTFPHCPYCCGSSSIILAWLSYFLELKNRLPAAANEERG